MRPSDPRPLDAVILDDALPPVQSRPSSGGWKTWLLASAAFCALLLCSGLAMWGIGSVVNLGVANVDKKSLVYHWESPEERLKNIAAAMNAEEIGCSPAELRELNRFFGRVMQVVAESDQDSFRQFVDRNLFAHRASLHPWAVGAADFDRLQLEYQLNTDLDGPTDWSRSYIIHVVWSKRRDEAIVYTILTEESYDATPYRWWLRRSGRSWLLCDWEDIDYGHSQASRWALAQVVDDQAYGANYWTVSAAKSRAYEAIERQDMQAARTELKGQSELPLPSIARDHVLLELAFTWRHCGRNNEALKTVEMLTHPQHHAGVDYLKAAIYEDLEDSEQSLAAASRYRAAAGCHPEVLPIEARGLEAAGRRSEAAECWWQHARLMPSSSESLVNFCRLATDQQRPRIEEAVARARKPVETALEIGESAAREDDDATVQTILKWLESQKTGKLAAAELTAAQCEQRGDYLAAADHYRAAIKLASSPDKVESLQRELLSAMVLAEKTVEGYEELPDAREAFEWLTSGLDGDEALISLDDLPPLVAAHAKRDPDDPNLRYHQALLLMEEQKHVEAERLLAEADTLATDEYLSSSIRRKRLECLYHQEQLAEALALYDDRGEAFRQLGWLCSGDKKWELLSRLFSAYSPPDGDPWIDYFQAVREQNQGNHALALAAVSRAEAADEESLEWMLENLKSQLLLASGNLSQAYSSSDEPNESFAGLVSELESNEDWAGVLQLAQIHAAVAPSDPAAIYHATKARWRLEQHTALVGALTPWPADRLKSADADWQAELAEWLVRSWLRLGHVEEARTAATRAQNEHVSAVPLLLVELQAGNAAAVRKLLSDRELVRDVFQRELFDDRELSALLSDPALADLRRANPQDLPNIYGVHRAGIVFMLEEPADWPRVKESLTAALGDSAMLRDIAPPGDDSERRCVLATVDAGTIVVTAAPRAYAELDDFDNELPKGSALRTAVEQHQGWIAIDMQAAFGESPDKIEELGQKVASSLWSEAVRAVYVEPRRVGAAHCLAAETAVKEQLAACGLLQAKWDGDTVYLYETSPSASDSETDDSRAWPTRRKELRRLAEAARVQRDGGYGRVRVRLTRGHATEDLWLTVVRSQRGKYDTESFIAELQADCSVWPHLKAGARVKLSYYQPTELELALPPTH